MARTRAVFSRRHLRGPSALIFVTVGNATQEFRRLLETVDALAGGEQWTGESVIVQTGNTRSFTPAACKGRPFFSSEEFDHLMAEANCIVTHAGCGTLLQALRLGKVPAVMARRKRYGEHVNDHQVQLVEAFAAEGWAVPAWEPVDLEGAVAEARRRSKAGGTIVLPTSPMIQLVANAVGELIGADP